MELTLDNMIDAIVWCSETSSQVICRKINTVKRQSATTQEIEAKNAYPYCENPAFSLNVGGKMYKPVVGPTGTETISAANRADLLGTLCCFYALDPANRPKSKAMKAVFDRVIEKQDEYRKIYFRAGLDSDEPVPSPQ